MNNPVEQFLQSHNITYNYHVHPAVFTAEQAESFHTIVPGLTGKNLFLIDRKSGRKFLFILPLTKKADLKFLAKHFGVSKLSFGSPDLLREKMWLEPGSVSPFGLINNKDKDIELYIDADIYNAELVNFHPNINTASLSLTREMFHNYLKAIPHKANVVEVNSNN